MATPREAKQAAWGFVTNGSPTWEELKKIVSETTFQPRPAPQVYGEDLSYESDSWADSVGLVAGLTGKQEMELMKVAKFASSSD